MLKKQKGITLIALIITIIVMLILVGVTINVVLNGGLFTKASEAAMETEKRLILEQIISLAEWDNNGKINVKATVDNVKEEFGADKVSTTPNPVTNGATSVIVTITGKNGAYDYKITTSEISIIGENGGNGSGQTPGDDPQALSELERYFFNEDGTGKNVLMSIDDNDDLGPIILFINDTTTIPEAEKDIKFMKNEIVSLQDGIGTVFIEYKGADYKFEFQMLGENNYQTILGSDNEKITRVPTMYSGDTDEERIKQYFLGYSGEGKSLANLVDVEKTFAQGESPTNIIFKDNDIINASTELIVPVFDIEDSESFEVTYNQKKYTIGYEIDENFGMVIAKSVINLSDMSDLEKLRLYFVDNLLFSFTDDSGLMNTDFTFKNTTTILGDKPLELKGAFGVEYEKTTVKYNDKYYIVSGENYQCKSVEEANLTMQQISNENLGKYVEYDSNGDETAENWIILYNDGTNGIQLLSTTVSSENYTLEGFNGYNNAVQILNTACYGLVTETIYKQSVRTIGTNPASTKDNPLDGENVANGTLKPINENYISDFTRMTALDIILNSDYWFAARQKPYSRTSDIIYYIALGGNSSGMANFGNGDQYIISYDGTSYREHRDSNRVLPVVTLKSGVTINTEGHTGLANDPYTLQ